MIPDYIDDINTGPRWFDDGMAFIQNRLKETRPHYLTISAVLEVCNLAADYNFYIKWYESGILHDKNDKRSYEPRDGWVNSYAGIVSVNSVKDARENNLIALKIIEEDIRKGYTAFDAKLERIVN